jgi:hypothetical protein
LAGRVVKPSEPNATPITLQGSDAAAVESSLRRSIFLIIDAGQHAHFAFAKDFGRRCIHAEAGKAMDFEISTEQPIAGGWLAYCARARDLQNTEDSVRESRDEKRPVLTEGPRLANRH